MKGVILAGGLGTRLRPLTLVTNKHLLPVYHKPMVLYPLATLKKSGITEIAVVCGREHVGHFIHFLGSGREHGVKLSYAVQDKDNGGIADALRHVEDFSAGSNLAVILGDNIFEDSFLAPVADFKKGAMIFLKKVKDPHRFGVPVFDKKKTRIVKVEEKPKIPKSDYAQTGFYLVDSGVFSYIAKLKPSGRGELEMTDVINRYLARNELAFSFVRGRWFDAGTFESLLEASNQIARRQKPYE